MDKGDVRVRHHLRWLPLNNLMRHLWWYSPKGAREIIVQAATVREAFKCSSCGTVVIPR